MTQASKLRNVLEKITDLPTLPTVVTQIMTIVNDPRSSAKLLAGVISHDQSLTAKVLRVVNSAFYGFPRPITSVHQATAILGYNAIKNMALSVAVFSAFGSSSGEGFSRDEFWRHAAAVGSVARLLARKVKYHELEEAFIGGLIHDIGKVLLDEYFHEDFMKATQLAREKGLLILSAERAQLGFDHTAVGQFLARKWNLPKPLTDVIVHHHDLPTDISTLGPSLRLVAIVHVADIMVRGLKIGDPGDELVPRTNMEMWKELNLGRDEIIAVKEKIPEEVAKAEEFLKISKED